jgi:hypothetical protein
MGPTTVAGNRTEGAVLAALIRTGRTVLLPFGGGHRYDLAYEEDGRLVKVQCKTARLKGGSLKFNTASVDLLTRTRRTYHGQVDMFGVFSPDLIRVYLVPVALLPNTEAMLRVEPAKNAQSRGIRWAADFEL